MAVLYLESSAVLTWLFDEPNAYVVAQAVATSEAMTTSTLTMVESNRGAGQSRTSKPDRTGRSATPSWSSDTGVCEVVARGLTAPIRARAGEFFPVEPVRSLDAIHLATILEAQELYPGLEVLTFYQRIIDNLVPLGLRS